MSNATISAVNVGEGRLTESWMNPVTEGPGATSMTEAGFGRFQGRNVLTAENYDKARKLVALLDNSDGLPYHRWQHDFVEAMGTDDFPNIFGDTLARELRVKYEAADPGLMRIAKPGRVPDFRPKSIYQSLGWNGVMQTVNENGEYPMADRTDETPVTYSVKKRGQMASLSFETWTNGMDLDLFGDTVGRYADSAIHTRNRFITSLIADANGPLDANFANVGTPALTIASLETAMATMQAQTISPSPTETAVPIIARPKYLMVPPALEMTALAILTSVSVAYTLTGDADVTLVKQPTANVVNSFGLELIVNPWLPLISSSSNGGTSWYLFTDPSNIPFCEIGSLAGHEAPEAWVKKSNAQLLTGGGDVSQFAGDFETDAIWYRLRYIFGGVAVDGMAGYGSDGTT